MYVNYRREYSIKGRLTLKNTSFFSSYHEATGEIVNSFFLLFWIHGHGRISFLEVKLFCFVYVVIVSQFFCTGEHKNHMIKLYDIFSQGTFYAQYLACKVLQLNGM